MAQLKYQEAREQFKHVLDNQKTITVPRLKRLMASMHFYLDEQKDSREVAYLKNEIKRLRNSMNRKDV